MRSLADLAALRLTECGVSPEKAVGASLLLTNGYLEMTMGQCSDLAFEGRLDIGLDDYLKMVSLKTGALIRCGMEMGALIGSDDPDEVRAFSRCGSRLGRAFQIRDDLLGIWGDQGATGKSVGNDIRRKKKSFPVVYALSVAPDPARDKLREAYSRETLDEDCVLDVLGVLDELSVAEYAERLTREQAGLALKEVDSVSMPGWAREEIRLLAEFLAARQY
jgi:geranylgeranyl diphosphate synthase type I